MLDEWGARWRIEPAAMLDLKIHMGLAADPLVPRVGDLQSEAGLTSHYRLAMARSGAWMLRNNSGALSHEGRQVRFGLGNDSAKINKVIKSSDWIGIKPTVITHAMVGMTFGRFAADELKAPGWHFTGTEREMAQAAFGMRVIALGGEFRFVSSVEQLP